MSADGTGPGDQAHIFFQNSELFVLRDKHGAPSIRSRSLPAIGALNRLWRERRAVRFMVAAAGQGTRIESDGELLVEVLPGDAPGLDTMVVAQQWAERLDRVFQSRGPHSGKLPNASLPGTPWQAHTPGVVP